MCSIFLQKHSKAFFLASLRFQHNIFNLVTTEFRPLKYIEDPPKKSLFQSNQHFWLKLFYKSK